AGAHTVWSFNRNWSLFGDFAANVLSTRSHILAQNKQFVIANSSSVTYFQNIEKKISYIQPLLEMLLGIGWDMWMQDDEYHLGIKIGWEEQMWFGNNNYILGSLSGGNADMSIQGFVFKARFDF
ncbi:MAG: hypothetical protein K9M13_01850, partial [Simkaniaceae bacterium]|nr:hypothetical protein [Simkaniaceae bacterium]